MLWQILQVLIGFWIGILAFILREHINLYTKLNWSLKIMQNYLSTVIEDINTIKDYFETIKNEDEKYIFYRRNVFLDKYYFEQFTISLKIKNDHFLKNIFSTIIMIEKLNNLQEYLTKFACDTTNRSPVSVKLFKKSYDQTKELVFHLPDSVNDSIKYIDKIYKICLLKRYMYIMWNYQPYAICKNDRER